MFAGKEIIWWCNEPQEEIYHHRRINIKTEVVFLFVEHTYRSLNRYVFRHLEEGFRLYFDNENDDDADGGWRDKRKATEK